MKADCNINDLIVAAQEDLEAIQLEFGSAELPRLEQVARKLDRLTIRLSKLRNIVQLRGDKSTSLLEQLLRLQVALQKIETLCRKALLVICPTAFLNSELSYLPGHSVDPAPPVTIMIEA